MSDITNQDIVDAAYIMPVINQNHQVLKLLPNMGDGPVGNHYTEINWGNGFEQWDLVRISTPSDGSCLFHAIANSFFPAYRTEILNGKHISRNTIIKNFRKELSEKLSTKISNDPNSPTHYDILNDGNTSTFAKTIPEFSLKHMQGQLDSNNFIGYGYIEFIGNVLNKDIYILDALRQDTYIYVDTEFPLIIKGNRNSIILYYHNDHYELVGLRNSNNTFDTHFFPTHSTIRFLYNKIQQLQKS